jgi:hypothetical protein
MARSLLTQRQQWGLLRFADNDGNGNLISAPGTDAVDNPALAQGYDAFTPEPAQQGYTHGQLPEGGPLENSVAIQFRKQQGDPVNGAGTDGGAGGGGTQGLPSAPGGGAGTAGATGGNGAVPLIRNPDGTYTSSDPEWAKLIARESGGRNIKQQITDVNSGGNEAFGLFQITPATWKAHGGQGSVYDSTPEQQAAVAANILRANPSGSDWGAGLAGRENAQALMRGLSSPSTSATATGSSGATSGPDTHGALLPHTQAFQQSLQRQFPQLTDIGGYRPPDGFNEHSSGHALDIMTSDPATQKQVRDWALKQPNVNYVLNQQKQWNPDGSSSPMEDRGSPTANHYDHLHVNLSGQYSTDPSATPPAIATTPDTSSTPDVTPTAPTTQPVQQMTIARRYAWFTTDWDDYDEKD